MTAFCVHISPLFVAGWNGATDSVHLLTLLRIYDEKVSEAAGLTRAMWDEYDLRIGYASALYHIQLQKSGLLT